MTRPAHNEPFVKRAAPNSSAIRRDGQGHAFLAATCHRCGKIFEQRSDIALGKRRAGILSFCGRVCAARHFGASRTAARKAIPCGICGTVFYPKLSSSAYCSRQCATTSRSGPVPATVSLKPLPSAGNANYVGALPLADIIWSDSVAERFWSKVDKRGPAECWPWIGGRSKAGYGRFGIGRRARVASRVAFAITHRRQPDGIICHSCDNPPCVNPAHLWEGSTLDNSLDALSKGRRGNAAACARGHEYNEKNAYIRLNPKTGRITRTCRVCRRITHQLRKERQC